MMKGDRKKRIMVMIIRIRSTVRRSWSGLRVPDMYTHIQSGRVRSMLNLFIDQRTRGQMSD